MKSGLHFSASFRCFLVQALVPLIGIRISEINLNFKKMFLLLFPLGIRIFGYLLKHQYRFNFLRFVKKLFVEGVERLIIFAVGHTEPIVPVLG